MFRPLIRLAAVLMCLGALPAHADLKSPEGMVMLTVAGDITETNRGPQTSEKWTIFSELEIFFDRAAAFDVGMLEAMERVTIEGTIPETGEPATYTGPRLSALLKELGAEYKGITATALDKYTMEIPGEKIATHEPIIATRVNGEPFDLGGRGPLMIVFPKVDDPDLQKELVTLEVWALFYIEVK